MLSYCAVISLVLMLSAGNANAIFEPDESDEEKHNEMHGTNLDTQNRKISGFVVTFHGKILDRSILKRKLKKTLREQLSRTAKRLPNNALKEVRKIPIRVYYDKQLHGGETIHENAIAYYDPNIRAVVFHNAHKLSKLKNFRNAIVLHELAHGYHHMVLGANNSLILDAYKNALETGLYRGVSNIYTTQKLDAYALTDHFEYFAELTETYFSKKSGKFRNDYYPFLKKELKKYDPVGYSMVRRLWRQE